MTLLIKQLSSPPTFEGNLEKTRTAKNLHSLLLALIVFSLVYILRAILVPETFIRQMVIFSVIFTGSVTLLWMTKHGFVQQSGIILVSTGWILCSVGVWTNGGIQAPGFASNYLLVALGTSILLGRKAGIGVALSSALAGLGMVVANNSGVLPAPGEPRALFPMWLTHVATFTMAALLFDIGTRDVRSLLEQAKRELNERERAEREGRQKTEYLNAIGQIAIQIATARADEEIYDLLAETIQSVLKPLALSLSFYDGERKELIIKRIVTQPGILAAANKIFNGDLQKLRMPVSHEMLAQIESETVTTSSSISEITFGAIPEAIASALQYVLNIGSLTGLSLFHNNHLLGTIFLIMPKNRPPVPVEIARTLSNLASVAIQRKEAEEALQESEARYRTLVETLPDSVIFTDITGKILYCNQQAAIVHGFEHVNQLLGTHVLQYFTPEEQPRVAEMIHEAAVTKHIDDTPFTLLKGSGSRFPGEIRASVIFDSNANSIGIIGITRDITERMKAEAERESLIRDLAAKNTELEQFTYTVSHDLKAPIITIKGFLGFLEKDIKEGKREHVHSDVQRISDAVDKMNRLLNELLELSRIGRLMNPPVDVSFTSIVQEALETVHGRLVKKNIAVQIADDLPVVCGDRLRLVEVVQNLIDNAAKFMGDQPQPRIEIGERGADKDGKPIFFVRDNGIGIEVQHHERVFGLFNKLDPQTEGTGVGLALVKRIVDVHGGRIWVESELGKGATFCFTLAPASTHQLL